MKRREILGLAGLLPIPLVSFSSTWPQSPISLVTPLASGDAADTAARLMGQELGKLLGASVVVVNKPGAGGSLGTQAVIRAPKDGYTILYAQNSPLTIRRVTDPDSADYNPQKDLTPLGLATRSPSVLVTHKNAPFKTMKEMVEYARKNPGAVRIGNAGPGSVGDISVQLISATTGTQLTSVNYKGAAPAITDLLGGHIDAIILALGAVSAHMRNGALSALAISSKFPEFPDIPTLGQLGYKQEILGVWFGFFMPAGVPQNVIGTVLPALEKVVRNSEIAARLQPVGIVQEWASAEKMSEEIDSEYSAVSKLLKSTPKN
ncbi:MAG: tripartite tricarboxylate transporter substrate binding protein [Variovorax sp.]|nr:tripartite tricarboxylate transporter substrate binding protein [Variovorax sp.]